MVWAAASLRVEPAAGLEKAWRVIVKVDLEEWPGSPVVRAVRAGYARLPAQAYRDEPADLTARQAVFYRNLIRVAEAIGSAEMPVDFELADGRTVFLDRGCVKIAEHAGFIQPLQNGPAGVVETVRLGFTVRRSR